MNMQIPNISDINTERLRITGKGFKSIKYDDGADCYVRIPEYLCENGIEVQSYNGIPKAYMNFKSDTHDSATFSKINHWLERIAEENFPGATVHPLGNKGFLKTKVELNDDTLDVVIFDQDKQRTDHTVLVPNCRVSSICMLKGVWCMNDTVSISLRIMQMRIFPPHIASLNTDECLIIDDEEDMPYVPYQGDII